MKKITKREVFAFIFGILTLLTIESIIDWENGVKAFKEGQKSVMENK